MKVAAFLFDLDGTLVDTETVWAGAMADFVCSYGEKATPEELLSIVVGHSWLDINRILHERFKSLPKRPSEEDAREVRKFYALRAASPEAMVIRSSVEFFLRAHKIAPCAIVSGSPHDDIITAAKICGINDKLSFVLGAGEYEAGKPSPSGYLKAAEKFGCEPSNCVVIEDSSAGVASALAAGMKVIALDRGCDVPQDLTGATWRVKDLSDFDFSQFSMV